MALTLPIGMSGHDGSGLTGRITSVYWSSNIAATLLLYAESVVEVVSHPRDTAILTVLHEGKRRDPSDTREVK